MAKYQMRPRPLATLQHITMRTKTSLSSRRYERQLEKKRKGKRGAKSAQTKSSLDDSSVMDMTSIHDGASSVGGQQSVVDIEEYHFNQIQCKLPLGRL